MKRRSLPRDSITYLAKTIAAGVADHLEEQDFQSDASLAQKPGKLICFNEDCTRELRINLTSVTNEYISKLIDEDYAEEVDQTIEKLEQWAAYFLRLSNRITRAIAKRKASP